MISAGKGGGQCGSRVATIMPFRTPLRTPVDKMGVRCHSYRCPARFRHAGRSWTRRAAPATSFEPAWLSGPSREVKEPAARQVLQTIQQVSLRLPGLSTPVNTTFLGPGAYTANAEGLPQFRC